MSALSDLFPRTRAEILRLLFTDGRAELHLRELARLAVLSPAGIQQSFIPMEFSAPRPTSIPSAEGLLAALKIQSATATMRTFC